MPQWLSTVARFIVVQQAATHIQLLFYQGRSQRWGNSLFSACRDQCVFGYWGGEGLARRLTPRDQRVHLTGGANQRHGCVRGRKLRRAAVSVWFTVTVLSRGLSSPTGANTGRTTDPYHHSGHLFCLCIVVSATTRITAQDVLSSEHGMKT